MPADAPAAFTTPGTPSFPIDGLSPYIVPSGDFYRIDTALVVPQVDVAHWKLSITGKVDHPFTLTFDDLQAMDQVEEAVTLSCVSNEVGGDLVGNARWQGVPLRTLLDRAGVQKGGTQIVGRAVDGFTVGFPTAALDDGRTALVAVGMNGEPLPTVHGFPARLVVAGLYGYVSATKWLSEIELTGLEDFDAYWVPLGWSKEAPVKTQSRIDVPNRSTVKAGTTPIAGVAWAPDRGIRKVEVQVDDGPWTEAQLARVLSKDTWCEWMLPWHATPGSHTMRVRATDGTGADPDQPGGSPRARRRHRLAHPHGQGRRLTDGARGRHGFTRLSQPRRPLGHIGEAVVGVEPLYLQRSRALTVSSGGIAFDASTSPVAYDEEARCWDESPLVSRGRSRTCRSSPTAPAASWRRWRSLGTLVHVQARRHPHATRSSRSRVRVGHGRPGRVRDQRAARSRRIAAATSSASSPCSTAGPGRPRSSW